MPVVQDELETLDRLLTELVSAEGLAAELSTRYRVSIQTETERIRKAFVREAFGLSKERYVERYIQYHQTALVELIDRLTEFLLPAELETMTDYEGDTRADALKFLYVQLEELLVYIERHFAKYFNPAAKSPESYRFMVYRELKRKVPDIRYALEKKNINKRLLVIILLPLDNFVSAVHAQEISYRRIIYLRGLLTELASLADNKLTGRRLDYKVCLVMGYLNYNTVRLYNYCAREITALVQDQQTLTQQIEKLAFFMKVVNQQRTKPGFVYNEKHASLREQLSSWLSEELVFLEKRQQLSINSPANANDPAQHEFRLKLNLSVAQFACLLRGLKDTGVIGNHNVLEMLRFFAGVTETKNTEHISWESLRTKYYTMEDGARSVVKDVAFGVFNYMRDSIPISTRGKSL